VRGAWACAILASACAGAAPPETEAASRPAGSSQTAPSNGGEAEVSRALLERDPAWRRAYDQASPSPKQRAALESVDAAVRVRVVYGAWCPDSRREVPIFWKALDEAEVRFEVEHIPVDRSKTRPGLDDADIRYVPTFIVMRGGDEVGRLVESPESGLLDDLLALMKGRRAGVVSGRPDMGASAPAAQKR